MYMSLKYELAFSKLHVNTEYADQLRKFVTYIVMYILSRDDVLLSFVVFISFCFAIKSIQSIFHVV